MTVVLAKVTVDNPERPALLNGLLERRVRRS
jgi:hypothetical protein